MITHSMSQVQCTKSIQAPSLTDSASREKSSLYSISHAMAFLLPDRQYNRATLLAPLQSRIPLVWRRLLSCRLALVEGCKPSWYDPFLHPMWRQGVLWKQLPGKPCQFRSSIKLDGHGHLCFALICDFFIDKWDQMGYCYLFFLVILYSLILIV